MLKFKKISLDDKRLFEDFLFRYKPRISEFTFSNLYCWRKIKKSEFCVVDDHLLISCFKDNKRIFYQPVGRNPEKIICKVLDAFPGSYFERVDEKIAKKVSPDLKVVSDRCNDDYVYGVDELANFSGKLYASKRNFVNRFIKNNPEFEMISADNIHAVKRFTEKWLKNHHDHELLEGEYSALKCTLDNYELFGSFGIVVYVGGKVVGFAIGEKLNEDTFVEHFEKADIEFKGAYQYVLNVLSKEISSKFKYLNREQDLGLEGLRRAIIQLL